MIDVKYFAGFVDADGSILIQPYKLSNGMFRVYPKVNVGQLTFRAQNLEELASYYNCNLTIREDASMSLLDLNGSKAESFLMLIKNHLVIKDELAEYVLSVADKEVTQEELNAIRLVIKQLRKKNIPSKNHPSRKWMAGYIDGDGCFYSKVKNTGVLDCRLIIASSADALAGLELIKKAFGGHIRIVGNSSNYTLSLSQHKVTELYEYIGQHLRIKKSQMVLVREYVGNNRHSKSRGATYEENKKFCETLATTKYIGR